MTAASGKIRSDLESKSVKKRTVETCVMQQTVLDFKSMVGRAADLRQGAGMFVVQGDT